MTSAHATPAIVELTNPGGALDLTPDKARVLVRMLRLLAQGRPVTRDPAVAEVAERGIDRVHADALLEAWAERDDAGDRRTKRAPQPPAHQMTTGGVRMWAWCGIDPLIFTHVLNMPITTSLTAAGDMTGPLLRYEPETPR